MYGEIRNVFGDWFKLYFIENNGMAFGVEWGGKVGKFLLTGFRIAVSAFGAWYLWQNIKKGAPMGFLIAISLILAGALGNIIDSVFYGVYFSKINAYTGGWFQGHVVDMFYAPMYQGHIPSWFPFWKGEYFTFFSPIWNFADACITVGVAMVIVGQKRFFAYHHADSKPQPAEVLTETETEENSTNAVESTFSSPETTEETFPEDPGDIK